MRKRFKKNDGVTIDDLIADVLTHMQLSGPGSEEYNNLLGELERLQTLKTRDRISMVTGDGLAVVVGNLLGIVLIVSHERMHVIASKALTQLVRPKLTQ